MTTTDRVLVTPAPATGHARPDVQGAGGAPPGTDGGSRSSAQVVGSLVSRARRGDEAALRTMFQQFIPADEQIHMVEYLGTKGIFGIGQHSFGCLTERRVADLTVGLFNDIVYQDGYLEHINSAIFYQPSLARLYVLIALVVIVGLFSFAALSTAIGPVLAFAVAAPITFLFVIMAAKLYYAVSKSGLVLAIREGIFIYMFTNRARLMNAARIWRMCTHLRDQRMRATFTG